MNKSTYLDKNVFLNLDTDVRRWTMILLEIRRSPQNVCSLNNMPGSFGRISVIPLRTELAITGADWLACTCKYVHEYDDTCPLRGNVFTTNKALISVLKFPLDYIQDKLYILNTISKNHKLS